MPSRSTDFVIAFPQAYLDVNIFMEIPSVMGVDENIIELFLKLKKSLYGLKKAGTNLFDLLKTGLERRGNHQSQVDLCIFYRKDSFPLTYVDDFVIISHSGKFGKYDINIIYRKYT